MGDCGGAAVRPRQSRRVFGLSNTQAERLPLGRRDPPHAAPLARRRRQGAHLHQRALRGAQAQARWRGGRRRQPDQVVLVSLRGVRATPNLHAACVVREPYCSAPLLREFVCAHVRVTSHVRACGRVCARLPGARRHTQGPGASLLLSSYRQLRIRSTPPSHSHVFSIVNTRDTFIAKVYRSVAAILYAPT